MLIRRLLALALLAACYQPAISPARPCSHACVERVKARHRAAVHRRHVRALAREMAGYRAHPMPWCTWGPESSGPPYTIPAFSMRRYLAYNGSSGAAGKFQIIPSTWRNIGGTRYAISARYAPPVIQERLARRLMRKAGIRGTWANC